MMSDVQFVFADRYSATGRERPNPDTVCLGKCEGMGCYPVLKRRPSDTLWLPEPDMFDLDLWQVEHDLHCNLWGVIADLWNHRQLWFWQSIGRNVWHWVRGDGYCTGWHFVKCYECQGTGKRKEKET